MCKMEGLAGGSLMQLLTFRGYIPYNEADEARGRERRHMPTISYFYGIIIVMYLRNEMWETERYAKLPPLD